MSSESETLAYLLKKIEDIGRQQNQLQNQLDEIKNVVQAFQSSKTQSASVTKAEVSIPEPEKKSEPQTQPQKTEVFTSSSLFPEKPVSPKSPSFSFNMEEFIGSNLINKIGIAILVIGVGIGAKYAIDNDMISPLMRIILGYIAGIGLFVTAYKLKPAYKSFSAVLLSGAMAVFYFITFAAYDFYNLIPQMLTFFLLVMFTAFTVFASIQYNLEVIALYGMVGAYAVPFLLSDGSGKVEILFSYMLLINVGLMILSFRKYWKKVYYASFIITWLIYGSWIGFNYSNADNFTLAFTFLSLFYLIFYCSFLSYKLAKKELFDYANVSLLVSNSFIFYGTGYWLLTDYGYGELLGIFTILNALIHFAVSLLVYKKKSSVDQNVIYLISGLVLVFLTITIPVQLDGSWVTLLWSAEAVLVFWIGRVKQISIYEKMSYPLMILSLISVCQDWFKFYGHYQIEIPESLITPIFNSAFMTSILVVFFFGVINFLRNKFKRTTGLFKRKEFNSLSAILAPAILGIVLFGAFFQEISNYYDQLFKASFIAGTSLADEYVSDNNDYDLLKFRDIWLILYSAGFLSLLAVINQWKFKIKNLTLVNLFLASLVLIISLFSLSDLFTELQYSYMYSENQPLYQHSFFHISIRYVSYLIIGFFLFAHYRYKKSEFNSRKSEIVFDSVLHVTILVLISTEWNLFFNYQNLTSLAMWGVSVLWGIYALMLIVAGIMRKKRHIRIGAIILFAITLLKLFFVDISDLETIGKTMVFILLGVLLLVISFLYNKYKQLIFGDETKLRTDNETVQQKDSK